MHTNPLHYLSHETNIVNSSFIVNTSCSNSHGWILYTTINDLRDLNEKNNRKDKKIGELLKHQRKKTEASDRSTQSSGDLPQSREDPQTLATKKYIEEMGEDKMIQLEKRYPYNKGSHYMENSIHPDLEGWHPHWATLKLECSMSGKGVSVPIIQSVEWDDLRLYRMARIEKYIDARGQTWEAIAYGKLKKDLQVWYDLEI